MDRKVYEKPVRDSLVQSTMGLPGAESHTVGWKGTTPGRIEKSVRWLY